MKSLRISFIGDSFVAGIGDGECRGWAGRICSAARARGNDVGCYNLGIGGNSSADIRTRWRREAEARHSGERDCRLVFSFGTNDSRETVGGRLLSPTASAAHARAILAKAKEYLPTLMIGPPPIGDTQRNPAIEETSRALASVCAELGVPYLAVFDALAASPVWDAALAEGDGVHPVAEGYTDWARLIEEWPAWRAWMP